MASQKLGGLIEAVLCEVVNLFMWCLHFLGQNTWFQEHQRGREIEVAHLITREALPKSFALFLDLFGFLLLWENTEQKQLREDMIYLAYIFTL